MNPSFKDVLTLTSLFVAAFMFTVIITGLIRASSAGAQTTGPAAQSCTASSTLVAIGHQFANTLVGTSSRRSWVAIQNMPFATNTVALALNDVHPTFARPWFTITAATSTSPVTDFRFGLSTELPYTGAVRAITNIGSSTISVTECLF